MSQPFQFNISPEPRHTDINLTEGNYVEIAFTIQNKSRHRNGQPQSVEILIEGLEGPAALDDPNGPGLDPRFWQSWLSLQEKIDLADAAVLATNINKTEWIFEPEGIRVFTVRIQLPEQLRAGTYTFRLVVLGIDDPDHQLATSEPVSFTVKSVDLDIRRYVIFGLIMLALVIVAAISLAILIEPEPRLNVSLTPPESSIMVGEIMTYTVTIQNAREMTATQVLLDYHQPANIIASTAFVPNSTYRHCDELNNEDIQCHIGDLGPLQSVSVLIQAVPGPGAAVITHTNTVTVSSRLEDNRSITPAEVAAASSPVQAAAGLSIVIDPDIGTPTVDEPVNYRILAWNNITRTETMSITYTLPKGMRFQRIGEDQAVALPPSCQQVEDDYFVLDCQTGPLAFVAGQPEIAELNIVAVPNEISTELLLTAAVATPGQDLPTAETTYATTIVNSALFFDGVDDYAELGLTQALETFTVEFWLQPFTNNDGQNFIGVHRASLDNLNLFLVGYYSGNLNITIGEDFHSVAVPKLTERYHVAVSVEKLSGSQSRVMVYVNGEPQAWIEPESAAVCDFCKIFAAALDTAETLPWVLGQDWDPIGQTIRASDFFEGTMSDVTIWRGVRTQEEIWRSLRQRPRGDEPDLVVYAPLLPITPKASVLRDYVAADGILYGPSWEASVSRYGSSLVFDGSADVLSVPGLRLSDFSVTPEGQVQVTMAGWVYVDTIPSQEQWLIGFASASGTTTTLPVSSGTVALPGTGLEETINTVTNAEVTQANLATAQGELLDAIAAQEALGVDVSQARIALQEARNTLYLTLSPLSQTAGLTGAFAPVKDILDNQVPDVFIQNLDALQSVAGIQEPVAATRAAKLVYDAIQAGGAPEPTSPRSAEPVRTRFQLVQAELAYAQSLVNLWQIVASNTITDTAILAATPLDVTAANSATDQLANVASRFNMLTPPDQVLLRLAALELAEQEQLAASYFALTVGGEPVTSAPTVTPLGANANDQQAIENIGAAQAAFAEAVSTLQPWLETQLDEDVRFLLYPNLATSIQNDQLRERLLQESGLRGFWDFNTGGGNIVNDASGNGLNGTLQNGAAFISTVPPTLDEIFNPFSLNFEGTNDRVEILPADGLDIVTGSFSAWFKAGPDVSNFRVILADEAVVDGRARWAYRLIVAQTTGLLLFDFTTDNGTQVIVSSNLAVNDSLWHHVAATRDDQTKQVTLYLDGIPQNSLAYTGQVDLTNNPLWIGQSPLSGGAYPFIGAIDDVRLYDRVLSADEITILAGGDAPFRIDEQLTLRKLLALRGLEELQSAQNTLLAAQEAEENLASAQASVTLADAEAARIAALAQTAAVAQTERQTLIDAVTIARNNVQLLSGGNNGGEANGLQSPQSDQPAPTTLDEATAQLEAAEAALRLSQQLQLQSLESAIASLQVREETLQDLDSRLDLAVNNAIEAGLQAAQKNNVELLIGPFLDWILGTRTPRRTTQEVVQEAALLAAQQALKTEVDFNVDAAQVALDAAVAERDRLIASGGNGRLRQDIINNINIYIESLNADVNAAKQSLDEALVAQQGQQTQPDIPLVLADAMAQEVAQRVATQIALRVRPNYRQLVTPNPAVGDQVRLQIQNELASALQATRNPVRWQLYVDTYFVINQLNQDLATGTLDNEVERQLTTELRDQLVALNLAILRVLDAENAILQPQFGFEALLNQVAAERNRAQNESELIEALTEALTQSNRALDAYLVYQNTTSQRNPKPITFAKPIGALTSDTLKIDPQTRLSFGDIGNPPAQDEPTGDDMPVDNPGDSPVEDNALLDGVDDGVDAVTDDTTAPAAVAAPETSPTPDTAAPVPPPNIWIGLIIDDDGHVAVVARSRSAPNWAVVKDEQPIVIGQWVHYTAVVSYDTRTGMVSDAQLLRNGDEVKGFDLVQNPITVQVDTVNCAPNFYIGGLCAANQAFAFAGRLDEIRVWNRPISEEEIDGWRDLPGEFYDEFAYWAFDDGPGRTNADRCPLAFTCDQSTHGFHLRVAGPAWVPADFGLENQGIGRP